MPKQNPKNRGSIQNGIPRRERKRTVKEINNINKLLAHIVSNI